MRLAERTTGTGPADVLLIHGWMMSGALYDRLLAAMDLQGLRVVVPDLRGAGDSEKPASGYSIAEHAADLWALADELGLRRPALVGHSMGGAVAQYMAAERPGNVSKLILLTPVPASGVVLPEPVATLFRGSAGDREKQGQILDMACLRLDADGRETLLDAAGTVSEAAIVEGFDAWTGASFAERLGAIRAETHVIATSDPFLPPAFLQPAVVDAIAGAQLHQLEGPGHYPQVERPGQTAALIRRLLA